MAPVRTFGHGTLEKAEIVDLLRGAGVEVVADVRRYPGSRRHPHVARLEMEAWLPEEGIDYVWLPRLGGRRRPDPDSPHVGLRNDQFRAYADHMETDEFAEGVSELERLAARSDVAVMCSEAVWWRCHRRLLADHLVLIEHEDVEHLFHDGRVEPHPPTPGVRVERSTLRYEPE